MMSRLLILASLIALSSGAGLGAPPAAKPAPSILPGDAEIQRIVDDRVVTYRDSVGLIVGVIEPAGRRLFARGPATVGDDDPVNGGSIFEIGSVTKVFTALLLADMVRRGEVALSDPATRYLPPGVTLPERGGHAITLLDLATHTSGLPKMPANVAVTDPNNPNADLTADQFYKSLQSFELTRDPGSAYEYSNAGYYLLGLALADRGKTDFETLLRSRILGPLKMNNTRISPSLAEGERLTTGYDAHLQPSPRGRPPILQGSDGMRSTADDLLAFLAANLGLTPTPLAPAMADMLKVQRPTEYAELKAALGWHVATLHGVEIVWHSGETAGYRAFIGFAPQRRTGVVVLSNAADAIEDIGVHLLDAQTPLRALHREASVNPTQFANYVGRYQLNENFSLTVSDDRDRLFIQGTGQPRAELFAEGDDRFFLRVANAEVVFQTDGGGRARVLSLTQDGKTVSAMLVP